MNPDRFQRFMVLVADEVERAETKYPENDLPTRALAVAGEAGECAQAVTKNQGPAHVFHEAMQTAATAYRLAEAAAALMGVK